MQEEHVLNNMIKDQVRHKQKKNQNKRIFLIKIPPLITKRVRTVSKLNRKRTYKTSRIDKIKLRKNINIKRKTAENIKMHV